MGVSNIMLDLETLGTLLPRSAQCTLIGREKPEKLFLLTLI